MNVYDTVLNQAVLGRTGFATRLTGGLQLRAALEGRFEAELAAETQRLAAALRIAVDGAGEDLQAKLRQDLAASRLARGAALSKTWRRATYPKAGVQTLEPAALVWSTMPLIQAAFEQGDEVKSPNGSLLTVPNPAVWPDLRVRRRNASQSGGRRDERTSVEIAEERFGPLRFIPARAGRAALLVAEVTESKAGALRGASATRRRTGRGVQTVIVFFLVKDTRLPRLLKGSEIRRRAQRDMPGRIQQRFERALAATPRPRVIAVGSGR